MIPGLLMMLIFLWLLGGKTGVYLTRPAARGILTKVDLKAVVIEE